LTDCASRRKRRRPYAEQRLLERIAVHHDTAQVPVGAARDVRYRLPDPSARARFGSHEPPPRFAQIRAHPCRERRKLIVCDHASRVALARASAQPVHVGCRLETGGWSQKKRKRAPALFFWPASTPPIRVPLRHNSPFRFWLPPTAYRLQTHDVRRARIPHPDDAAVPAREGAAYGRAAVLSNGRLL